MKHSWKCTFSLLLSICLVVAMLPVNALAETEEELPAEEFAVEVAETFSEEEIIFEPGSIDESGSISETKEAIEEETISETEEAIEEETISETEEAIEEETISEAEEAVEEETTSEAEEAVEEETISEAEKAVEEETTSEAEEAVEEEIISEAEETVGEEIISEKEEVAEEENIPETEAIAEEENAAEAIYPWDAMSREEFAVFVYDEANYAYIRTILTGVDAQARASFLAKLAAATDEELIAFVTLLLNSSTEESIEESEEVTEPETEAVVEEVVEPETETVVEEVVELEAETVIEEVVEPKTEAVVEEVAEPETEAVVEVIIEPETVIEETESAEESVIIQEEEEEILNEISTQATIPVKVTKIEITGETQYAAVSKTRPLTATVSPSTATNKNVTWSSSNTAVATVSSTGVVTGVKTGTATITATAADGSGVKGTFSVTVWQPVNTMTADQYLAKCKTTSKAGTATPIDTTKGVQVYLLPWTDSVDGVERVSSIIVKTSMRVSKSVSNHVGNAWYQLETPIVQNGKSYQFVYPSGVTFAADVKVTGITLSKTSASLYPSKTVTLTTTIAPSNATNKNVTWKSSNTAVATVTSAGVVKGVAAGTATITATAADGSGKTATCKITVNKYVTGITLDKTSANLAVDRTITLTATVKPTDATNKNITWTSSNTAVATVTSAGAVKGVKAGTATITATAADGSGVKATFSVTVWLPVSTMTADQYLAKCPATSYVGTITPKDTTSGVGVYMLPWTDEVDGVQHVSSIRVKNATRISNQVTNHVGYVWYQLETPIVQNGKSYQFVYSGDVTYAQDVKVSGITLSKTSATMNTNTCTKLTATIAPTNATNKNVTWKSSNTAIATVNSEGEITGVAPGTVTITVTAADGSGKTATCTVKVNRLATGITLDLSSVNVAVGRVVELTPTVKPTDATNKNVTWSSSNTAVATVTSTGTVKGVKAGTVTITATAADGSGVKGTCSVVVWTPVSTMTADQYLAYCTPTSYPGTITPKDTTKGVAVFVLPWADEVDGVQNVPSIYVKNSIRIAKRLTNHVGNIWYQLETPITQNGKTYQFVYGDNVTYGKDVSTITLSKTTATVNAGSTVTLTATINPSDAANKTVTWKSSNTAIATVTSAGVVKGVAPGTATITATAADGSGKTATCKVTVKRLVSGITLNKTSATLNAGSTVTLTATVSPSDASNKSVTWSSGNTAVATVTSAGVVTGVAPGTATIKATAADGSGKTASCTVTVKRLVTEITLSKTSADVDVGSTVTLTATVSPSDASNKSVTWSSSNAAVATVSAEGVVTGVASGTATITATAADGSKISASCNVSVKSGLLAAPEISTLTNATSGVTVKWDAVPGAVNYRVFYKTASATGWTGFGNTTGTSLTVTGLTSGTKYSFTVRCVSADGKSYTSAYDTVGKSITYTDGQLATPVISSVANAVGGVTVKWGAVSGAVNYRVFIKNGTSWKNMGNTTSTSYTVTGLTSGTNYTFTVRCLSADGTKFTSAYDTTGKSITYVAAPVISSLTNASNGVTVKWDAVPGAVNYRVFYKAASATSWTGFGNTTGTSATVTGLTSGTKYSFTIRCVSADGKSYTSSYDNTGKSITYTPAATGLETPMISSVTNAVGGVTVKWGAVSGAAQYRVFIKSGTSWKTMANTTATSATITGLESGTKYTFTVRCLSADGKSYTSSFDSTGKSITYVAAPALVSVAKSGSTDVLVKWNAVPGATNYRVFYKTDSGSWTKVADTTSTSYTVTGLSVGTKYTFTVRCVSTDGKSFISAYDTTGLSITR